MTSSQCARASSARRGLVSIATTLQPFVFMDSWAPAFALNAQHSFSRPHEIEDLREPRALRGAAAALYGVASHLGASRNGSEGGSHCPPQLIFASILNSTFRYPRIAFSMNFIERFWQLWKGLESQRFT